MWGDKNQSNFSQYQHCKFFFGANGNNIAISILVIDMIFSQIIADNYYNEWGILEYRKNQPLQNGIGMGDHLLFSFLPPFSAFSIRFKIDEKFRFK